MPMPRVTRLKVSKEYRESLQIIGANIKAARERRQIRQQDLGEALGFKPSGAQSRIGQIESGRYRIPLETIVDIAKILGVPVDLLFRPDAFRSN